MLVTYLEHSSEPYLLELMMFRWNTRTDHQGYDVNHLVYK